MALALVDLGRGSLRPDRFADPADGAVASMVVEELPPEGDGPRRIAPQSVHVREKDAVGIGAELPRRGSLPSPGRRRPSSLRRPRGPRADRESFLPGRRRHRRRTAPRVEIRCPSRDQPTAHRDKRLSSPIRRLEVFRPSWPDHPGRSSGRGPLSRPAMKPAAQPSASSAASADRIAPQLRGGALGGVPGRLLHRFAGQPRLERAHATRLPDRGAATPWGGATRGRRRRPSSPRSLSCWPRRRRAGARPCSSSSGPSMPSFLASL